MKKFILCAILTLGLVVSGCGNNTDKNQNSNSKPIEYSKPIEMRLGTSAQPNEPAGQAYIKFAELVEKYSQGKAKVQTLLGGSVCQETDCVESVLNGSLELGTTSNGNIGSFTDAFLWLDLPYIIKSQKGLEKVLLGPIGDEIRQKVEKENNLKILGMMTGNGGFRVYLGTKEVKKPEDMKGMKVRAVNTPVEIALWKAWGAIPTPLPLTEVYTALSQKIIDGEGLQLTWADNGRHFEIAKYSTNINYGAPVQLLLMRADKFNALPQDIKDAVEKAAKEAEQYNIQVNTDAMAKAKENALKAGVKFYDLSPEEMKVWQDIAPMIWKQFENKIPPAYIERILKAQE
ncbi:TRAP transporter substrate-binding protein [Neomoorella mulderi]|uniref:C4-dicarboxylate-binding periplasmic protein n=1 Tax=Moorella mulderi DSM 14980 TaxID=1122241 RepID=A0A151AW03_9FIRM|nr:TRAP transporter substrate-binding protein [Moorella mulderi]KYH31791.1 C4-dicarboxylate-binding periplasmic protein precursor [Moorella mulderi DSM 14980]